MAPKRIVDLINLDLAAATAAAETRVLANLRANVRACVQDGLAAMRAD